MNLTEHLLRIPNAIDNKGALNHRVERREKEREKKKEGGKWERERRRKRNETCCAAEKQ